MVVTVALSNMHFASNLVIIISREESSNPLRRRASPQAPHWNEDRSERMILAAAAAERLLKLGIMLDDWIMGGLL